MQIEIERGPWRRYNFMLATEVLAKAGLPKNLLKTTGLVFEDGPLRRPRTRTELALNAKRHLFRWSGHWPVRVMVKLGHEQAFLDLIERIRSGKEVVEQYPAHVVRMKELSVRKRAERAEQHGKRMAEVHAFAARHEPVPSDEDKRQAAIFLKRWKRFPAKRVLYKCGLEGLLDSGLFAGERASIIWKLKPSHFVERTNGGIDPASGLWTFQRALTSERIVVRMVLHLPAEGPPRCEVFTRVFPEVEHSAFDASSIRMLAPGVGEVQVKVGKRGFKMMMKTKPGIDLGAPYTTAQMDVFNLQHAMLRFRSLQDLPLPEDFERFREQYGSMYTRLDNAHLDAALGWPTGRWLSLEFGALPSEMEADVMLRLEEPKWLYEELVRRFPDKYALPEPGTFASHTKEALGQWDWKTERMFADGAPPDVFSGFARKDMQRIGLLAGLLSEQLSPSLDDFWRVIFLCDMKHYLEYGQGATGIRWQASAKGPEPHEAEAIMGRLRKAEVVRVRRTKYKGKEAMRIYPHVEFYPTHYISHPSIGETLDELDLERDKFDSSIILRECQRAPLWDRWVADRAFIPYDIAFSMRI